MSAAAWLADGLAAAFAVAGALNLLGVGSVRADFARWGYPAGFHRLVGAAELAGAAMLLRASTQTAGALLLALTMAAALATLLRHREGRGHVAAACLLSVGLLGLLATA